MQYEYEHPEFPGAVVHVTVNGAGLVTDLLIEADDTATADALRERVGFLVESLPAA